MAKKIKVGDTVILKPNIPAMTVESIRGEDLLSCVWFDIYKKEKTVFKFHRSMLKLDVKMKASFLVNGKK